MRRARLRATRGGRMCRGSSTRIPERLPCIPASRARGRSREINGYVTGNPAQHLKGFGELKDDGSTTCASWIYSGCFPAWDQNMTARRTPDPPGVPGAHLAWGWAWPANRRVMYNRDSEDL